jgi:hypothetical protein
VTHDELCYAAFTTNLKAVNIVDQPQLVVMTTEPDLNHTVTSIVVIAVVPSS